MVIGVSTHVGVRGRFSPSPSYLWLSSCLHHGASGSRPILPIRPVACCTGTTQEMNERISKDWWLSETDKLRLKKKHNKLLTNIIGGGCTDLLPQYVDSKIRKEVVELGNVENGRVHILTNHRQDIIHQVPTHTVRHNSPSMNESAVDNKHQQSLIPESRFPFQNPQLERPILNLQLRQYDRVAKVVNNVSGGTVHSEKCFINDQHIKTSTTGRPAKDLQKVAHQEKITDLHDKVIIVDNVSTAKEVAVRHNSPSMNESVVDNKHQQSLIPESRSTFQNPHPEKPILNLQLPQDDRVAKVGSGTVHTENCFMNGQHITTSTMRPLAKDLQKVVHQIKTTNVYDKVIIVDNVSTAKKLAVRHNSTSMNESVAVRHNSPSMNESVIDNKRRQSLIPKSRSTFQNPQLEKPILNLQLPQYDHVAEVVNDVSSETVHSEKCFINGQHITTSTTGPPAKDLQKVVHQGKTTDVYDKVIIVDNVSTAKEVARLLITEYKNFIHACDTEVANIDVKSDTPVGHGDVICFSIYSGPLADFGNGKSCVWVDVLDGGVEVLMEFAPFFQDPSIKKVWHNYSFDSHIIGNNGIKLAGFHADTMHLARLFDSSRTIDGGYSLEALTSDPKIMSQGNSDDDVELISGKMSMKSIFGKKKLKKDGTEGKIITLPPVEVLQREERKSWIRYSALDAMNTLKLFNRLKEKLMHVPWFYKGSLQGTMYNFYENCWRPFGVLLVKMESEGILVDKVHLSKIEKLAVGDKQIVADKFRRWASKYCEDAKYMNVGSDTQIRQLLFDDTSRRGRNDMNFESKPESKSFKVPNTEKIVEEGKKTPLKYRTIHLHKICEGLQTDMYTASGFPSVSADALKVFAGNIPSNQIFRIDNACKDEYVTEEGIMDDQNLSDTGTDYEDCSYGTAFEAFGGGNKGREACEAIAALCETSAIDSLITNFIIPLQENHISCVHGRIHCSLNINTETGRLSARRPNLQNQPALEKDRYKIRQAFIAEPGKSLIVADYGQLELRILAHLADCKSMLEAFKAGGDFHSRTAMNMYAHVREAVKNKRVLLEWDRQPGEDKPPVPLLKDAFASERRKAKMLNFSIAYGKTPVGLSRDWKVSLKEAKETLDLWYKERKEVMKWQDRQKKEVWETGCVKTLLGRSRHFTSMINSKSQRGHIERAAINTPVQGSAADVAMCAMLEIDRNVHLKELGWKLLLQLDSCQHQFRYEYKRLAWFTKLLSIRVPEKGMQANAAIVCFAKGCF
ncbi:DNA polymerase I A, chloroplastic-like isoform X2 [Zingiber officinale]|uniref:DNA polymerase I A, chloroplastic-like isoform X2 n=1 Tax=Zingiber officinale TaxID=94328 RepID=UPI001C4C3290|nr:DNA polymerase I A, chloroplastic-like isoform X2 [Zingiber officinale]